MKTSRETALKEFREAYTTLLIKAGALKALLDSEETTVLFVAKSKIETIIAITASAYRIAPQALTGKGRSPCQVEPRWVAMYCCRQLLDLTFQEIGDAFKRDHGTVMYACQELRDHMNNSAHLSTKVEKITETVRMALAMQKEAA